jgi:chromosome segregation ATPase
MEDEIAISQEELNNEIKIREREEYYEDKLLELKMKSFLDNYKINHVLSKYKTELDDLNKVKNSLLNEKEVMVKKISEIEEEKNNYDNTINSLDKQISEAENESKKLDALILEQEEYVKNISLEDNLLEHIIKTFPDIFKKKIYDICSKNVTEALKTNKNTNKNINQKESNLMVVSSEREEFVSKGEQSDDNSQENNSNPSDNSKNNFNPMMGYNRQFMMYPMYMMPPGMRNMNMQNMPQNLNGNSFYFFPVPMPNIQQNNNNKKK